MTDAKIIAFPKRDKTVWPVQYSYEDGIKVTMFCTGVIHAFEDKDGRCTCGQETWPEESA